MIKRQKWCIEKIPGGKSWRYLRMNDGKNGVRSFSQVAETEDIRTKCAGHIHLCFTPLEYYLFNDEFPRSQPELLAMQISKRFSDRGLTMDAGNFVHRAGEIAGKAGWYNCLFAPHAELTELYSFIQPWKKIHSCRIVPGAAAVAGLIKTVTEEAVLVFLLGNSESQVLVVQSGIPLYNQSLTLLRPGVIDEALIPHAIDFARVLVKKDYNIDNFHITCLGQARDSVDLKNLGIQEWTPDFSQVLKLESQAEVLLYPQLFGAGFVDSRYDFLPKEYTNSWRLQSFSLRTSILAAVAGVALLGGWLYLQPLLKDQRLLYQALSSSITLDQQALSNRLPETATLETFERLKTIRTLAREDFHLDDLAEKLSLALPENVHITSLKVQRKAIVGDSAAPTAPDAENGNTPGAAPEAGSTNNALAIPELIQSHNVVISVNCTTNGDYGEVTSRFEHVIIALNGFFKVTNMAWTYTETDKTGQLNCELAPKREVATL